MRYLDSLDLDLIRELEIDARQTYTGLATKLSISRPTLHFRMRRLLDANIIRVVTILDPLAMGLKTRALFGINTHPRKIDHVASEIASHRPIHHVAIYTGQYDLQAWGIFAGTNQMFDFIRMNLGKITGITSIKTMVNLRISKASFAMLATDIPPLRTEPPDPPLDDLDLAIIKQLRKDSLQTHVDLARKTSSSSTTIRRRVDRLLQDRIVSIVAVADPVVLGYPTRATIGINTRPNWIEQVAHELEHLRNVHHILINTGQYDIIAWTDFVSSEDLSRFVRADLGSIPGLVKHETMICLKIVKDDFTFTARVY